MNIHILIFQRTSINALKNVLHKSKYFYTAYVFACCIDAVYSCRKYWFIECSFTDMNEIVLSWYTNLLFSRFARLFIDQIIHSFYLSWIFNQFIHWFIELLICWFIRLLVYWFIHSFIYSWPSDSFIFRLVHSFTKLINCLCIHPSSHLSCFFQ